MVPFTPHRAATGLCRGRRRSGDCQPRGGRGRKAGSRPQMTKQRKPTLWPLGVSGCARQPLKGPPGSCLERTCAAQLANSSDGPTASEHLPGQHFGSQRRPLVPLGDPQRVQGVAPWDGIPRKPRMLLGPGQVGELRSRAVCIQVPMRVAPTNLPAGLESGPWASSHYGRVSAARVPDS